MPARRRAAMRAARKQPANVATTTPDGIASIAALGWLPGRVSAADAAAPEAVFVSMIDNLDAKMGMVQRALRQADENTEFSERLPGLSSALLTRPVPPPPAP
jgi:hypothetical protein